MHNRYNNDPARLFLEQDTEGKYPGKASAYIRRDDWIQMWIEDDAIDCVLDRSQKPPAKAALLVLIVCRSRCHFSFGSRMKLDGLHASLVQPHRKEGAVS